MTAGERPLPATDDLDTAGYWEAARRDQLTIRVCGHCGQVLHMPRAYCHHCGTWSQTWKEVAGRGRLYSWTTVEHQVHPAFPVPYTIVLVDLDDAPGTRLISYLPGSPELVAGEPMEAWFEHVNDDVVLPQWRPMP